MTSVHRVVLAAIVLGFFTSAATIRASQQSEQPAIVGRWDITVQSPEGNYPSWIEVKRSGYRTLVGQFVGQSGSARPISRVEFTDGQLRFSVPPQWEQRDTDLQFEGKLENNRLSGFTTSATGARLSWTASRAPSLRRASEPQWGKPIALLNGTDLTGWRATGENQWKMINGVLTNTKAGGNLLTTQTFTDFKLHAEFRYPKNGNSGIYLRGRHEVQIEDSAGQEPASVHLGGIYGFLVPNEDAAGKPGEWQSFDITLVGRLVSVILNGKTIICNQEIPGITGGAIDSDEAAPGPLLLQGDHGPVEFRNMKLTPAK
jgi:3-keto-disaccharide hydrolase